MNCPNCETSLGISSTLDQSTKRQCCRCQWESPSVDELLARSPEYRLARLQAAGAEPGWYGPDGKRCRLEYDSRRRCYWMTWRQTVVLSEAEARMCGFVEVPCK